MQTRLNPAPRRALQMLFHEPIPQHGIKQVQLRQEVMDSLLSQGLIELKPNSYGFPTYYLASPGSKALRTSKLYPVGAVEDRQKAPGLYWEPGRQRWVGYFRFKSKTYKTYNKDRAAVEQWLTDARNKLCSFKDTS